MAKIVMSRAYLRWEYYQVSWTDINFDEWKKYLKRKYNDYDLDEAEVKQCIAFLDKLTWDDAAQDYQTWQHDCKNPNLMEIQYPIYDTETNNYTLKTFLLAEMINQDMEEDCWNCYCDTGDVIDSDGSTQVIFND